MLSARSRLIIAAMLLGPVLLYWGLGLSPSERRTLPPEALQHGEDFFIKESHTRVFNASGSLEQLFSTPRLAHFPERAFSELSSPHIEIYGSDGSRITSDADKGILPDDRSKTLLLGDVRVKDKASSGVTTLVNTEKLALYPESKVAETDQPVTIISDNVRYDAVGMKASFETHKLTLLSNVQGTHKNEK